MITRIKTMIRTLSTGLAILIVTTATLDAAEYFVSPMGSDQNDGSRTSPFQTLNHAAKRMGPEIRAGCAKDVIERRRFLMGSKACEISR